MLSSTIQRTGGPLDANYASDYRGVFGRLFANLPRWEPLGGTEDDKQEYIWDLAAEMIAKAASRTENKNIPSGYTYLGQFITHDLTFDATAGLDERNEPIRLANLRTPRFDLDCVYGRGPSDQPYLYDPSNPKKFLIGSNDYEDDLPRVFGQSADAPAHAVIGDSRNDENVIISQMHLAFLKFHNRLVDDGHSFAEAKRLTQWHYQWLVLDDFLPKICGEKVREDVRDPSRCLALYDPVRQPFTPVEFSAAAFRFGHAIVRRTYTLSDHLGRSTGDGRVIISGNQASLVGNRRLPQNWTIQWDHFVPYDKAQPQLSMSIGPAVPFQFGLLPLGEDVAPGNRLKSLPFRTLLRGWRLGLPSGQCVARRLGKQQLERVEGSDLDDPLWIYILREAEKETQGAHLGEVGALLVASVFLGFMFRDPTSFVNIHPGWRPEIAGGGSYQLADFIKEAGMPMTSGDWRKR